MNDIIIREVTIKRIVEQDSYIKVNENLAEKNNTRRPFNPLKQGNIWAKMDKNGQHIRAFNTIEEQEFYMPLILKKGKNTPDYNELVENFWRSVFINWDGESCTFNTSFKLNLDVKVKLPGMKDEVEVTKDNFRQYTAHRPYLEWYFGEPVNLTDYWKWRYCLNTSQVANDINIATNIKAKNMEYYLYTKEDELKIKNKSNELRLEANKQLGVIIGDENKVEAILRLFERERIYEGKKFGGYFLYENLEKEERIDLLINMTESAPQLFIKIATDSRLLDKLFVYKCISYDVLRMPEGSTMVMYGDERIGNTIDETVIQLQKSPKLKDEINNRLGLKATDVKKKVIEDSNKLKITA